MKIFPILPPLYSISHTAIPTISHQSGIFVVSDEPTLTHHYYPNPELILGSLLVYILWDLTNV